MFIQCWLIPSTVWRFPNSIPVPLQIGKLALDRKYLAYILGVVIGFWLIQWVYSGMVYLSVHPLVPSDIHKYICTSIGMFMLLSAHLIICHYCIN